MKIGVFALSVVGLLAGSFHLTAQEREPTAAEVAAYEAERQAYLDQFPWKTEGSGELGKWATIQIPNGFRYLDGRNTNILMESFGNVPDEYEGMIAVPDVDWFVIFQFQDTGYVKDDEKDDLNAAKLLKEIQSTDKQANEYRASMGLGAMHTIGWTVPPRYNDASNNLEWGLLLRDEDGYENVNYNTKLLGRNGIMNVTLVCDPEDLDSILSTYQGLLVGYQYKSGKSYAEFEEGDKIADYGLTALIAGGALYGAAKLGILANLILFFKKGFKLIIVGVVAIGAAIKKFFSNLGPSHGMDRTDRD